MLKCGSCQEHDPFCTLGPQILATSGKVSALVWKTARRHLRAVALVFKGSTQGP